MSDALSAVRGSYSDLDLSKEKKKNLKKYLKGEGSLVEKTTNFNGHFVKQQVKEELKRRK